MRPMTPKWRTTALILAILGFTAATIQVSPVAGAINAGIWFGLVYLAFLIVSALRR